MACRISGGRPRSRVKGGPFHVRLMRRGSVICWSGKGLLGLSVGQRSVFVERKFYGRWKEGERW